MIRPQADLSLEALAARIEALEAGGEVAPAYASAASATPATAAGVAAGAAAQAAQGAQGAQGAEKDQAAQYSTPVENVAAVQAASAEAAPVVQTATAQAAQAAPATSTATPEAAAARTSTQGAFDLSNPAALQRFWQTALSYVKKEKAAYHVLLINSKPVYRPETGSLVVAFPAESDFAFKAFQKPETNEVLARSIAAAYGAPLAFSYEQVARGAANAAVSQASAPAAAAADGQALSAQSEQAPGAQAQPAGAQAQVSEANEQEFTDLKDALSLFGEGVTIEEC